MKRINLATLISRGVVVAGVGVISLAMTSCGGGGGGNGVSSSGFYQLSVDAVPSSGVVLSVDPTSLSIPEDTWQFTVSLNAEQGASATSAFITSASICFGEPGLSVSCQPVSLTNNVLPAGGQVVGSADLNFYKLGETALQANPYQSLTVSAVSSSIPLFLTIGSSSSIVLSSSSQSLQYLPTEVLSASLIPSTVEIRFSYTMPATVSSTVYISSSTITPSATTVSSSSSVQSYQGLYVVSGICADNGNGGFNTISSDTGISCTGSISYASGVISGFAISQTSSAVISSTIYSSVTSSSSSVSDGTSNSYIVVSSSTAVNSYSISPNASLSATPSLDAFYMYGSSISSFTSNVVYGYIPSTTTFSNTSSLYVITSVVPQGVYVLIPSSSSSGTSSSTIYYPCSQIQCSYSNGYFSATLPASFTSSDQFMLSSLYQTTYAYNPSVTVTNHLSYVSIPYTFTVNVEIGNGQQMTSSYNGNVIVESP